MILWSVHYNRYINDDSETLKDSIGLTITDGINSAYGMLLVQVIFCLKYSIDVWQIILYFSAGAFPY